MQSQDLMFPIGISDFQKLRRQQMVYVDKSWLIHEVLHSGAEVLLLPRPRRFGKTLNLSMLRYFLEKIDKSQEINQEERRSLFSGLQIENSKESWAHFQKYPVIFITFKDIKSDSWESCFAETRKVLAQLYKEHQELLQSNLLTTQEKKLFSAIADQEADVNQCSTALLDLSQYLFRLYQQPVMILIDEYDTPLNRAFSKNYYEEAITFFRTLLSSCLKDNRSLYKAVMTGILRIARESIFSGLNNLAVYSILQPKFSSYFGFTEKEVKGLTEQLGQEELFAGIQSWYNGYRFWETTIYNPWSVLSFLDNVAAGFRPYWVSTASSEFIQPLLFQGQMDLKEDIETLLQGGMISKPLQENMIFSDVKTHEPTLWSLLLFSGYLTPSRLYQVHEELYGDLKIPNKEVALELKSMSRRAFEVQLGDSSKVKQLIHALLEGNAELLQEHLTRLLLVTSSYQDTKGKEAEAVYHAFFRGLLATLEPEYQVRSNRESGTGLYDLMVLPTQKNRAGVVLELKALKDKPPLKVPRKGVKQTPEKKVASEQRAVNRALKEALNQLKERQYLTELQERGAAPIHQFAVVFSGKQAFVRKI